MDTTAVFVTYLISRLGKLGAALIVVLFAALTLLATIAVAGLSLTPSETVVMAPFRW